MHSTLYHGAVVSSIYVVLKVLKIAGVDEVGRGPLAGPVVAAAVVLDPNRPIDGLCDSKKLTKRQREHLYALIERYAIAISLGRAEVSEIDQMNIFHASLLAMKRAVEGLHIRPDKVLIDGKFCPDITLPCQAIIKGDVTESAISAASIIAKVTRDQEMAQWDQQYPGYGFAQHSGYPTKQHIAALSEIGVCPIHRRSFAPVAKCLGCVIS